MGEQLSFFSLQKVTLTGGGVLGMPQAEQLGKWTTRRMQLPESMLGNEPAWMADTCCLVHAIEFSQNALRVLGECHLEPGIGDKTQLKRQKSGPSQKSMV